MRPLRCLLVFLALFAITAGVQAGADSPRPNIVLIMTDDQGYGDLGYHNNPVIRTPHLDKFARESVRFKYFYVCPVCAPTRASLLTGRYNYRTGVTDTYLGRAMMYPDEVTLAEMLAAAGYRTGIVGKWHLGDCYPLRAMDQGFQESLVHAGGGIGQPSDYPPGSRYFNPLLYKNGKAIRYDGYCSDIFTDAALDFINRHQKEPFFLYLAFNCPHGPLQVPQRYYEMYRNKDLSPKAFPKTGHPIGKSDPETTARIYGMVTNIDDNLGRLFARLDELKLRDNTIVIFLTDNGPQQPRYNGGLLERKGSVHEGGVRVACFVRWPAHWPGNRDIDRIAAHIDIVPTLREAAGLQKAPQQPLDGRSLVPLLEGKKVDWPERTLYFQWHRGDVPELYRACAARSQKWRLVQPQGAGGGPLPKKLTFQLYNMERDPLEQHDVAEQHPDIVARMKKGYEDWFKDVSATRGYAPPRIVLGSAAENPVTLTRQDWRGSRAGWTPQSLGHWEVQVAEAGTYSITVQFAPQPQERQVNVTLGAVQKEARIAPKTGTFTWEQVPLAAGPVRLEAAVTGKAQPVGVNYVIVRRVK